MKKNIITTWSTLLLLLLYFGSAAQESPPLREKIKNTYDTTKTHLQEQAPVVKQKLKTFERKLHYGIGANVAYSTTHGITRTKYSPYGFSGDSFQVMPTIEYAAFGVLQYPISSRLEVEVGLGYAKQKEDIYIYPSALFSWPPTPDQLEKHLVIDLDYLHIPVQFNWRTNRLLENPTLFSLGVTPRFLLREENNYNDLIYHLIDLVGNSSKSFLLTAEGGLTQRFLLANGQYIDTSLFASLSQTPYMGRTWGFLANIKDSQNLQLGIQLKYFFN